MHAFLHCPTGKKKVRHGEWCQDCNGFHDLEEMAPLRISVRTIAHMLHDDEITPRDAAIVLFLLTQESVTQEHHHHD